MPAGDSTREGMGPLCAIVSMNYFSKKKICLYNDFIDFLIHCVLLEIDFLGAPEVHKQCHQFEGSYIPCHILRGIIRFIRRIRQVVSHGTHREIQLPFGYFIKDIC